jgi:hypothetical protein
MQSVGAAAAIALVAVALVRALRDFDVARIFASAISALSASSLVKPSGSSSRSERILPGTTVGLGFSVGLPVYGIFFPFAGGVEVTLSADSDGVAVGALLSAVVLGEGVALGAALRSSSGDNAGACVVVGASEGTVVVLVEDVVLVEGPGVADSGAGAVVLGCVSQ